MQIKSDKQDRAKEQAHRILEKAEQQRAASRFERGLLELQDGRYAILKNSEFVDKICVYLYERYTGGNKEKVTALIDELFSQLGTKGDVDDKIILSIFEKIGKFGIDGSNIKVLQFLCSKYTEVLSNKFSDILISLPICQFLSTTGIIFVRSSLWDDVENLFSTLWKTRTLSFDTIAGPVTPVPDILSAIATNDVIEKILQYHNSGDHDIRPKAKNYIRYLGSKGVSFLLNRLIYSVTKDERFLIMELIGGLGERAVEAIRTCLNDELPWYAVRNMIYIITEMGDTENFPLVEEYLKHPDIRVQQQVVACIIKLGGPDLEGRLLNALSLVNDEMKMKLVMQLGAFQGENIANGLVNLLHKKDSFAKNIQDELLFRICISMRSFPFPNVINLLKHFLQNREAISDKIIIAIQETINILEPKIRHAVKGEKNIVDDLTYDFDPEKEQRAAQAVSEFLDEINSILKKGEKEKASILIYKKIIDCARRKDFQTAERLRDKLLDINPDALQDVIRAAEIIEEEKEMPVTSHHVEIWEELYETMSTEEFDAFYYLLRQEKYNKNELIVTHGEIDPCLYFINSGVVQLSCRCGTDETFLKRLKAGDVVGIGQFFSASVWTVTLTAQKRTQFHVLSRKNFLKIKKKFPEIEEKLLAFCKKKESIRSLVSMSGKDRRNYARYPINVTVNNILLDPYGGTIGKRIFQGEMIDLSRGGLSFSIRISKKDNADLLLGRQIISEINLRGSEVLKCFGAIVGVMYQSEIMKEFSVHVKFYSEIDQKQVTDVLNLVI